MIENILQAFENDVIVSGKGSILRKGILHGDCNDANLIVDGNFSVKGVIDFGDSVER
jgi:Ser/Thr protein kinase RdoA (MazF antagonist)